MDYEPETDELAMLQVVEGEGEQEEEEEGEQEGGEGGAAGAGRKQQKVRGVAEAVLRGALVGLLPAAAWCGLRKVHPCYLMCCHKLTNTHESRRGTGRQLLATLHTCIRSRPRLLAHPFTHPPVHPPADPPTPTRPQAGERKTKKDRNREKRRREAEAEVEARRRLKAQRRELEQLKQLEREVAEQEAEREAERLRKQVQLVGRGGGRGRCGWPAARRWAVWGGAGRSG